MAPGSSGVNCTSDEYNSKTECVVFVIINLPTATTIVPEILNHSRRHCFQSPINTSHTPAPSQRLPSGRATATQHIAPSSVP